MNYQLDLLHIFNWTLNGGVTVKLYYELSNIEAGGTFNCNINANPFDVQS